MNTNCMSRLFALILMALALPSTPLTAADARLEIVTINSRALKNNPLHDSSVRSAAVFSPAQAEEGRPLPIIYYLPGFGYSFSNFDKHKAAWLKLTQKVADEITPMIFVIVDGHTRWCGSQYLNSAAQGNYQDYVCHEIVNAVERLHPAPREGIRRVIAGHSSGGFGALRLGMARPDLFAGVIAMSPDSDFPVTHRPLVEVPAVKNLPLAQVKRVADGSAPLPKDGDIIYAVALSAAYAPRGFFHRGQFDWLYDDHGKFRESVWQRWLDNDPLTLVTKNSRAFAASQSIYLEGAAQDEYQANIGARAIFAAMTNSPVRHTFYEPPGHHSDHVLERLQRGLAWVWNRPVADVHP